MNKVIDWWNIFFILLFILISYLAFQLVMFFGEIPNSISIFDLIMLLFATFRLTRLTVYDSITLWFRNLVEDARPLTFLGTIKTLVNCPWCMGLWYSLMLSTIYFAWPISWFFIFVLALGGGASLLQILSNLIGWSAQEKKEKTLSRALVSGGSSNKC